MKLFITALLFVFTLGTFNALNASNNVAPPKYDVFAPDDGVFVGSISIESTSFEISNPFVTTDNIAYCNKYGSVLLKAASKNIIWEKDYDINVLLSKITYNFYTETTFRSPRDGLRNC